MRNVVLSLLVLGSCSAAVQIVEYEDTGTMCMDEGDLVVRFDDCLSSSCDTLTDVRCDASLEGGALNVTSYARIERQSGECTADCGVVEAACVVPLIEDPDTVQVTLGSTTVALGDIADCTF